MLPNQKPWKARELQHPQFRLHTRNYHIRDKAIIKQGSCLKCHVGLDEEGAWGWEGEGTFKTGLDLRPFFHKRKLKWCDVCQILKNSFGRKWKFFVQTNVLAAVEPAWPDSLSVIQGVGISVLGRQVD